MKKQKLVIVGGGSTYTIGMIMGLIAEKDNFPLEKLVLYDTDYARQEPIGKAIRIILSEHYPELQNFSYTSSKEEAYTDIDFAFLQIRVGGLSMRIRDEEIPLSYGVVGQETCGPGGMAYGLRSIQPTADIVADIRRFSPDAFILNYTNPAAIVALALDQIFPDDSKLINVCDMPIAIMMSYADILGIDIWDLTAEYFGLNHFGWFTKISDKTGKDYTEQLKNAITSGDFKPKDAEIANDPSWQATFKQAKDMLTMFPEFLPNTYLQYYFYPNKLAEKENPTYTRAKQVIHGREKRVFDTADTIIKTNSLAGVHLEDDVHGRYMIRIAASLAYNRQESYIVITRNNGIIPNLPADAMVEVPCALGHTGSRPFHVGPIKTFYKGLLDNQYAYEKLVCEAYFEHDHHKLLEALTLNRTVIDADLATQILNDLTKANRDYWPQF